MAKRSVKIEKIEEPTIGDNTVLTFAQAIEQVRALGVEYGKGRKARHYIFIRIARIVAQNGVDMTDVGKKAKKGEVLPANEVDKLWTAFVDAAAEAAGTGYETADESVRSKYTAIAKAAHHSYFNFGDELEHRVLPCWNKQEVKLRVKLHSAYYAVAVAQNKIIAAAKKAKGDISKVSDEDILKCCLATAKKNRQLYEMVATQIKALEKLIDPTEPLHLDEAEALSVQKAIALLKPMAEEPKPLTGDEAARLARLEKLEASLLAQQAELAEAAKTRQIKADMEANKLAREAAKASRVLAKGKSKNGATA